MGFGVALTDFLEYVGRTLKPRWSNIDIGTSSRPFRNGYFSGNVTVAGNVASSGFSSGTVAPTVAAAGSTIADATELTEENTVITTGTTTQGTKLSSTAPIGATQWITNLVANANKLYPHSGSGILVVDGTAVAAGDSTNLATLKSYKATKVSATNWNVVTLN